MLVYGNLVTKWDHHGRTAHPAYFYMHEKDSSLLQWISNHKEYNQARVDLSQVSMISSIPTLPGFSERRKKQLTTGGCQCFRLRMPENKVHFLSIIVRQNEMVLEFGNLYERDLFWQGLQELVHRAYERKDYGNPIVNMANKYFVMADKDGNHLLSKKEIKQILVQMHVSLQEAHFEQHFQRFDTDNNGAIDQQEFQLMTLTLMSKPELLELFKKYIQLQASNRPKAPTTNGTRNSNRLTLQDLRQRFSMLLVPFKQKLNISTTMHPVEDQVVDEEEDAMSYENLQRFFFEEQEQVVSMEEIAIIVEKYCDHDELGSNRITFITFINILFNDHNSIIDPELACLTSSDMDYPLTDYYIYSSHNTYLMAHQLTGLSSAQAYKHAFNMGCKCVEIDCWDGVSEPVVTHGHTLVSTILFRDVIKVVKDYGFVRSPYPVILSIELHCSIPFQKKMSQILWEILDEQLYIIPTDWEKHEHLPSPEQLRMKVIVKGAGKIPQLAQRSKPPQKLRKKAKRFQVEDDSDGSVPQKSQPQRSTLTKEAFELRTPPSIPTPTPNEYYSPYLSDDYMKLVESDSPNEIANRYLLQEATDHHEKRQEEPVVMKGKGESKVKTELCLLSCYGLLSCRFNVDDPPESCWQISSIGEDMLTEVLLTRPASFMKYNQRNITRVYPKGSRITSSNYSALPGFIAGAQLIAMNLQTNDEWLLIYRSHFHANGGSGYVLKPPQLRADGNFSQLVRSLTVNIQTRKRTLNQSVKTKKMSESKISVLDQSPSSVHPEELVVLHIISGQQLPCDQRQILNPYLEISLKGMPIDEQLNQVVASDPVKGNGFNPIFNQLVSFTVYNPWFATIIVMVLSKGQGKIAQAAIPIRLIRNGYRTIKLENEKGQLVDGSYLLVQVRKKSIK